MSEEIENIQTQNQQTGPPSLPLHDYQQAVKNFLLQHPRAGIFLDVGFGKTLIVLSTLMDLGMAGLLNGHVLVIAPKPIARATWIDEMKKWGINARYVSLIVNEKDKQLSKQERLALYQAIPNTPSSFYFINREMIANLVDYHTKNNLPWPFPTVVVDELQSFKTHNSQRFLRLKSIMPRVSRFIGMTGTPIPNGLMDLWAQIYLIDGGQRLGYTISWYRNEYFDEGMMVHNVPVSWNPKPGAEAQIYQRISDIVISVKNPSIKLPPVTYNDVVCHMTPDEMAKYRKMMKDKVFTETNAADGTETEIAAVNAAVLTAKLSQMASGALYLDDDGTTGKDRQYIVIHEHKLDQLEYIINNTGDNILVAYHFKSDLDMISKRLTEIKQPFEIFDGSPNMIHKWNQGLIPVMLLQPASAGHGINIQDGGHTLVWYTLPWSLEHYIQTNGRLNRQGQKFPVVIHHLIMQNTIDDHIVKALEKKDISEKALIESVSLSMQSNP